MKTLELHISGMDCAECTAHVRQAIASLPGVEAVDVFLASEKAAVRYDPARLDLTALRQAVANAGYAVADAEVPEHPDSSGGFGRRIGVLLAAIVGTVLLIVVLGEWLGLIETLTGRVPAWLGYALVLASGLPIFRDVLRAALRRQITSHTLMTLGALAALAVGQWVTAAIVVLFMRVGAYVEQFTAERARRAVKDLATLAPQTARVVRDDAEHIVPIAAVQAGDLVVVRPGETIPVDGEVVAGRATVNQATITGESMPVEVSAGRQVFAATIATLGSLRVRATHIGTDTTFGRIVRLVEEAEAHRADVQRFADRFSAYYLPIVVTVAALTLLIRRDPLATAAVLVVACSCAIALATPIAMLASIGAAARHGLLIKGGKYLEALARADVLLIDKTGTLTLGRPRVTDIVPCAGFDESSLLALAAAAERDSEHPLAEAVRAAATEQGVSSRTSSSFEALPGVGVRACVDGHEVVVGSPRATNHPLPHVAGELQQQGKTVLYVSVDGGLAGLLAAIDTLRPEVPEALEALRALGVRQIEVLTGDTHSAAAALLDPLRVQYQAGLLPQDKIAVVRDYQARGRSVVMVGDGVNDAPALAQADVGIAMGAAGSDIAVEAAHVALMRDDWWLVPEVLRLAQRTMRVVKGNLLFTAVYNLAGLTLAALGILPPFLAAVAQSIPDLGILVNSSRLLRYGWATTTPGYPSGVAPGVASVTTDHG